MPEDDATDRSGSTGRSDWKGRLVSRFLTPIAAAAASAAAGYAVKKAPDVLERALPKLRSLAPDADSVGELPGRAASAATNAATSVGDLAQDLGGRAKALVTPGQPTNGGADRKSSLEELAQRRDERTRSREARRKARSS